MSRAVSAVDMWPTIRLCRSLQARRTQRSCRICVRTCRSVVGKKARGKRGRRRVGPAPHRRARADAARVDADDVEPVGDLARDEVAEERREPPRGAARASGVDEQRADPPAGVARPHPGEVQLDGRTLRLVVVERHRGGRALEAAAGTSSKHCSQSSTGTGASTCTGGGSAAADGGGGGSEQPAREEECDQRGRATRRAGPAGPDCVPPRGPRRDHDQAPCVTS